MTVLPFTPPIAQEQRIGSVNLSKVPTIPNNYPTGMALVKTMKKVHALINECSKAITYSFDTNLFVYLIIIDT